MEIFLQIYLFIFIFAPDLLQVGLIAISGVFYFFINNYISPIPKSFIKSQSLVFLLFVIACVWSLIRNYDPDLNLLFRYGRCVSSIFIIYSLLSVSNLSSYSIFISVRNVLFLHAISVIIQVIDPSTVDFFLKINGYNKKLLALRSTGLVSGYDFAGFYTLFGMNCQIIVQKFKHKSIFSVITVLFLISTILTSRFNIFMLAINLFLWLIVSIKYKNQADALQISIALGIITMIGLVLVVFSTSFGLPFRNYLQKMFPSVYTEYFYKSYADYSLYSLNDHFRLPSSAFGLLFGTGRRQISADPGYINTISRIGLIGMFIEIKYYLTLLKIAINEKRVEKKYEKFFLVFFCLYLFVMQSKLIFFFSNGVFELGLILLLSLKFGLNQSFDNNKGFLISKRSRLVLILF